MRDQDIRKALDKYATRKAPRRHDLWPAVRQQVTPARDGVHVMAVGGRAGVLLPGAVLALVVIAALFVVPILQGRGNPQSAGSAAQATATPASSAAAVNANGTDYGALLTQNFAAQLGVSADKIDPAFAAAMQATLEQAVKDGSMDAAVAQQMAAARTHLGDLAIGAMKVGVDGKGSLDAAKEKGTGIDTDAILSAVAGLFGMKLADLNDALKNGETLTSLEQKHNVSHEQVRQAGQAAASDALAAGVQGNKWTQADADALSPEIPQIVDNILAKLNATGEADDPLTALVIKSIEEGAAQALGISRNDLTQAVSSGQSLTSLEQAHNVSHDQVRAKAIEVATAALSAGVTSGSWTQAEADAAAKTVPDYADKVLGKMSMADEPKGTTK